MQRANAKKVNLAPAGSIHRSRDGSRQAREDIQLHARWNTSEGQEVRQGIIDALRSGEFIRPEAVRGIHPVRSGPWPDLRGIDLSGLVLRGAQLQSCDLSLANLSRADLSKADLTGANLRGAFVRKTILRNAKLIKADLSKAVLEGADLEGALLAGSRWRSTILISTTLAKAKNVPHSNLRQARFLQALQVNVPDTGAFLGGRAVDQTIAPQRSRPTKKYRLKQGAPGPALKARRAILRGDDVVVIMAKVNRSAKSRRT